MANQDESPTVDHIVKVFPVEGQNAIAELWFGDAPWAHVELSGMDLAAVGWRLFPE